MSTVSDGRILRELIRRASDMGCFGDDDESCPEAKPEELEDWCHFCLMSKAANVIEAHAPREIVRSKGGE